MAANRVLMLFEGGKRQAANSKDIDAFIKALSFTSDGTDKGVYLTEVGGHFAHNSKKLTAIGDGTSATDAASKGQMDTALALKVSKSGDTMSGNLVMSGGAEVTGLPATPTGATAAASKAYVDAISVGARFQQSVAAASVANVNLASSPSSIDGHAMVAGERILLKDQTDPKQNGIYDFVSAGAALVRSSSLDNTPSSEVFNGVLVPVVEFGTVNASKAYVISSIGTGSAGLHTIGTDNITWTIFNTPTTFTASTGVWLNGTDVQLNPDNVTLESNGATANGTSTARIKDLGVSTAKIAAGAVTAAKLGTVTDGTTLDQAGAGSTLEIKAGGVGTAQLAAAAVTAAKLGAVTDGSTLDQAGAGSTLEIKAGGVGTTQLGATSVTAAKLGSDVAGSGLSGGNGSALTVAVGDGIKLAAGAVATDYAQSLTNDNGSTIAAGKVVYLKSNGNVDLAVASLAALDDAAIGVVQDATIAAAASGLVVTRRNAKISGFTITGGGSFTPGKKVYVSTVAGEVSHTAPSASGQHVYSIGRALTASIVLFDPQWEIVFA